VISWVAVVAGATAATVIAALLINGSDGKKNEVAATPPPPSERTLESLDPNAVGATPTVAPTAADTRPSAPPAPKKGDKYAVTSDPKTWPDACDLVTDEQIRLVVPTAGRIDKYGTIAERGYWDRDVTAPIRSTTCEYTVEYPDLIDQISPLKFEMQLHFAAAPDYAKEKYASTLAYATKGYDDFKDYGTTLGMDATLYRGTTMVMRDGGYFLEFTKTSGGSGVDQAGDFVKATDWLPEAMPKVVAGIAAKI